MAIQLRRDTAANWTAADPTLSAGQPGFETDTGKLKVGDGATAWTSLGYFAGILADGDKGDITVSGGVWSIDTGTVSLAKMADMATASLIYRKTAGAGAPEVQTLATLKTDLGLTGTNSGDQTFTLTGDVTGTGTGSFAATIANDAVTYAKMQNVSAASRLLGRGDSGSGDVEEITLGSGLSMTGATLSASGSGTVTSVGLTVPAGLTVSGSPVTTTGTLAVSFDTGYSIPLTADTGKGVTAHGWGNHASAGYVVSGGALGTPLSGILTNCTFPTLNQNTTGSAASLTTARAITITGDVSWTVNFDGSAGASAAGTIANDAVSYAKMQNVSAASKLLGRGDSGSGDVQEITLGTGLTMTGTTLSASGGGSGTVTTVSVASANGFAGSVANATTTPAITLTTTVTGVLKGDGTAISAALAGTDFVAPGGALGTPSSGTLTNCTFPTLNQNTTGSAATWTTARNLAGNSVNGSANVAFANKFIVQGTTDTGLSGAQFLGSLGTGIVKNTTATGVLSIAVAGDFPTLNQNTTGSAATLTTPRAIYGNNFDGSAALTQVIASNYGGTGNGFTKFSGPTSTEKTFTLPDSSATILTSASAVTVAQGGTGQTSFTDGQLLIGNSTGNTLTKATLTAGANITITNAGGSITIAASGGGGGASEWEVIDTATPTGTATVNFTSIPATYSDLLIVFEGISLGASGAALTIEASGDNNTTRCVVGTATVSGGGDTLYGAMSIPGYRNASGFTSDARFSDLTSDTTSASAAVDGYAWRIAAGINALRLSAFGDNFDGGTITLYGLVGGASGGSGDVVGPASATDNAIARYDSTTGKLIQNSAATVSDDGIIRSATNSGANAVAAPLINWAMLTADYTLTSTTAEQKAFNTTANGALTLPAGIYTFDCFLYLTTMSATSGNLAFDPIGAGTAVTDRWGQSNYGADGSSPLAAGTRTGSASVTQQTPASAATAGTGTGLAMSFTGMFRISTGGTIIPSVSLVTAAAAVVKEGSWFQISKIGESSETSLGAWT